MNLLYSVRPDLGYSSWFSLSLQSSASPRVAGLHTDGGRTREVGIQVEPPDDDPIRPPTSSFGNLSEINRHSQASGSVQTLQHRASLVLERVRSRTVDAEEINRSFIVRLITKHRGLLTLLAYCEPHERLLKRWRIAFSRRYFWLLVLRLWSNEVACRNNHILPNGA